MAHEVSGRTLRDVTKRFGPVYAVSPVDLEAEGCRTTVLIRSSGCGKLTVLRVMIGLTSPDQGDIAFDGTPLVPANAPALRHRMGYIIQGTGLFPYLTAQGNITLMARHLKRSTTDMADCVDTLYCLTQFPEDALVAISLSAAILSPFRWALPRHGRES